MKMSLTTLSVHQLSKAAFAAAAAAAALAAVPITNTSTALGQTLNWAIDSGTTGAQAGNGTWADGAGNWWNNTANVNANWDNSIPNAASFGHVGVGSTANYTVTLGSNITAASITKNGSTSGLTIIAPDAGGLYKLTVNGNFTMTRGMQIDAPLVLATGVSHNIENSGYPLIINSDITQTGGANTLSLSFGATLRLTGNNSFSGGLLAGVNPSVGTIELGTNTAPGTGALRLGRDNVWKAINGNRTLANSWVPALASTRGRADWSVTFAGDELHFTTTDILRLEGDSANTDARWRFIVNNPKTTLAGGIDNGTSAGYRMGIVKEGTGMLVINGNSAFDGDLNYTEAITVRAGALIMNGSVFSNNGTSGQKGSLVESGGILGGTGTLNLASGQAVTVQSGGLLAPGHNGSGTFTINGNLALDSGALFAFDPGSTLDLAGTLSLDSSFGVASLRNSTDGAIDWSTIAQGTYTLMNTSFVFNSGNISNFGSGAPADLGGGKSAYFQQGSGPSSLQLVVVPEPTALALMAVGSALSGLVAWRRRRG